MLETNKLYAIRGTATDMSDISKVLEVDDTCSFWMDISGFNQCIMKKT